MDNIAIIHHRGNPISECLKSTPHLSWKTCLREIIFLSRQEGKNLPEAVATQTDESAYSELLEIICGLQSPVLGETQVFGQFKNFLKEQIDNRNAFVMAHRGYFQALITDAKALREEYRGLLSSAGYGSISRKLLKDCERIAIVGSGELATEIFTLLKGKSCQIFTRNPKKEFFGESLRPLHELHGDFDAVILAAPVENSLLKPHVRCWRVLLDWRAESSLYPAPAELAYYPISTLFQIVEREKELSRNMAEQVRLKIHEKAKAYFNRVNIRPQGWDDVCA